MATVLDTELAYFAAHKDELTKEYGNKYIIVSGEEVCGAFETMEEALQQAAAKFGLKSVLIKRPSDADIEWSAPALTLGILGASFPHTNSGGQART